MTEWATFVGLTGVVTVLLLALSHASQEALDTDPEAEPDVELSSGLLLANVALSQGLLLGVLLAAAWYTEVPLEALGIGAGLTGMGALAAGTVLGIGLYLGSELGGAAAGRLGFEYDEGLRELLAPDSAGGWAILLGLVLPVIAFFEEFLFRAALIGAVAAGYGVSPWLLAVLSSMLFAIGHGAQGNTGILVTGLLGFVLAAGFVVTESLLVVVVAHYLVNALEFVVHEGLGIEWT
ncbi:CPBP family intramembrane glutamic endopeptidase [Halalkalicoccus tibetensis]|uniref:CPBP family intramembrane glutamic endopeptidase n=1 Tax=Halalkalicoccus tibetensis TaxID=175632 RepID=A0ABD5V261_9EURY